MSYVLRVGSRGAARLAVLAEAAGPGTQALLDRLPWQPGWRCLDVGCGIGLGAAELQARGGRVTAVDRDPSFLALAASNAPGAELHELEATRLEELEGGYDLVFARYLLSHLDDPAAAARSMASLLRPGGWLVWEDVDFPGHTCDPPCPAFERYLALYQEVVRRRGGDARRGRQLWRLAEQAGCQVEFSGISQALHRDGAPKRVAELTLAHVGPALLQHSLVTRSELAGLLRELRDYRRGPSQLSIAPTYQLCARKANQDGRRS